MRNQKKFEEATFKDNYATHLVAMKKWSKLNEKAVLKLRRKMYTRASYVLSVDI